MTENDRERDGLATPSPARRLRRIAEELVGFSVTGRPTEVVHISPAEAIQERDRLIREADRAFGEAERQEMALFTELWCGDPIERGWT